MSQRKRISAKCGLQSGSCKNVAKQFSDVERTSIEQFVNAPASNRYNFSNKEELWCWSSFYWIGKILSGHPKCQPIPQQPVNAWFWFRLTRSCFGNMHSISRQNKIFIFRMRTKRKNNSTCSIIKMTKMNIIKLTPSKTLAYTLINT